MANSNEVLAFLNQRFNRLFSLENEIINSIKTTCLSYVEDNNMTENEKCDRVILQQIEPELLAVVDRFFDEMDRIHRQQLNNNLK